MTSTDTNALSFLSGKPIVFADICLVYSPTLREIVSEGIDQFYKYISIISIQKPEIENDIELKKMIDSLTDFQYLMMLAELDDNNQSLIQRAIKFFTKEDVMIVNQKKPFIIIGPLAEKRILNEENFYLFQDLVLLACAMRDPKLDTIELLPTDSPQVRKIKLKMIEGRKKRKSGKKAGSNDKELELSDLIASLAIKGPLNIINIWDITYYAFQDQLKRAGWQEEFDINTRASLAGAKVEKEKLSYWIKSMTFS